MFFSANSVQILQFNILELRGEFHPHTSSYIKCLIFCVTVKPKYVQIRYRCVEAKGRVQKSV